MQDAGMGNGKWEMGNGKWEMGNGKWEIGIVRIRRQEEEGNGKRGKEKQRAQRAGFAPLPLWIQKVCLYQKLQDTSVCCDLLDRLRPIPPTHYSNTTSLSR